MWGLSQRQGRLLNCPRKCWSRYWVRNAQATLWKYMRPLDTRWQLVYRRWWYQGWCLIFTMPRMCRLICQNPSVPRRISWCRHGCGLLSSKPQRFICYLLHPVLFQGWMISLKGRSSGFREILQEKGTWPWFGLTFRQPHPSESSDWSDYTARLYHGNCVGMILLYNLCELLMPFGWPGRWLSCLNW